MSSAYRTIYNASTVTANLNTTVALCTTTAPSAGLFFVIGSANIQSLTDEVSYPNLSITGVSRRAQVATSNGAVGSQQSAVTHDIATYTSGQTVSLNLTADSRHSAVAFQGASLVLFKVAN